MVVFVPPGWVIVIVSPSMVVIVIMPRPNHPPNEPRPRAPAPGPNGIPTAGSGPSWPPPVPAGPEASGAALASGATLASGDPPASAPTVADGPGDAAIAATTPTSSRTAEPARMPTRRAVVRVPDPFPDLATGPANAAPPGSMVGYGSSGVGASGATPEVSRVRVVSVSSFGCCWSVMWASDGDRSSRRPGVPGPPVAR